MTDDNFKEELTLFACCVEQKKARGILVDVSQFRHEIGPGLQEWKVKNISNRLPPGRRSTLSFSIAERVADFADDESVICWREVRYARVY